jgi:hypothetical protein
VSILEKGYFRKRHKLNFKASFIISLLNTNTYLFQSGVNVYLFLNLYTNSCFSFSSTSNGTNFAGSLRVLFSTVLFCSQFSGPYKFWGQGSHFLPILYLLKHRELLQEHSTQYLLSITTQFVHSSICMAPQILVITQWNMLDCWVSFPVYRLKETVTDYSC